MLRNSHSAGGLLTGAARKPGALSDGFDSDPDPIRDLQLEALAVSVSMLPPVSDLLSCSYDFAAAATTATPTTATGTNSSGTTVNRSKQQQVWGSKAQLATILPGTNPLSPAKLPLAARPKGSSSTSDVTAAAAVVDDSASVAVLDDVDADYVSTYYHCLLM